MNAVEVEFVGGPMDGTRMAVHAQQDGQPGAVLKVQPEPPIGEIDLPAELEYRREVNPSDDGPLWIYRICDSA